MFKIRKYMLKNWYLYLLGSVCLLGQIIINLFNPELQRRIVDDVIVNGEMDLLLPLALGILGVCTTKGLLSYVKEFTFDKVGWKNGVAMRRDVFRHIQSLSVNYFDKTNTGEIMSRMKEDVENVCSSTGFIGMLIVEVIIHCALSLVCIARLDPTMLIVPLIGMPICGTIAVVLEKKLDKNWEDISEETAKLNTVAQEDIAGVRTVKAFAREKFEIAKFLSHNKRYYDLNMKNSKVWIKYYPIINIIIRVLPMTVIIAGGRKVIDGEMTIGTLTAIWGYVGEAIWPMDMLGWLSNEFASAYASSKKIRKIMAEKPVITSPAEPVEPEKITGRITFENVSLSFDDKKILDGVSFDLKSGQTLGIMGATGAGKTTVINLLQRFYDPDTGRILCDGVDIKDMSLETLRKVSACVMQDVFLFSDSVSGNIEMGLKGHVSEETLSRALRDAQAADFVNRMEDGANTLIGERGVGLSGGQKQRISIARAFAKKAPVLVLDDSTSALDSETEQEIQETLRKMTDVTKIIIAHRISAVSNANEIIVLEDGKISERGTHKELMEKKGYYYKTYVAQYGDPEENEALKAGQPATA